MKARTNILFRHRSVSLQLLIFLSVAINISLLKAQSPYVCDSAIEINYTNAQHLRVHAGGTANPLLSMPHAKGRYFEKPHTVVWFTFLVPYDTSLTFELMPENHTDDLDFLLFKDLSGNLCNSIMKNKRPVAIRANIASNAFTTSGSTGLSDSALHDVEPPGRHPAFSKSLKVKKGERYYLAVDDYTRATGTFELSVNLHFPEPVKPTIEQRPKVIAPATVRTKASAITLNIVITDSAGTPVKARIKLVKEFAKRRAVIIADTTGISAYTGTVVPRQLLKVICIGEGYLLYQSELRIADSPMVIFDTVRLASIKEHRTIVLQDIEFEPEQDIFLAAAAEPLSELLAFMQNNPGIHILIKGYVNDPFTQNSGKWDMDLSEKRAKAVMKYLTDHGINKNRMDWKGYGNKDMLYPNPQTAEQQIANRRVEIEMEK